MRNQQVLWILSVITDIDSVAHAVVQKPSWQIPTMHLRASIHVQSTSL